MTEQPAESAPGVNEPDAPPDGRGWRRRVRASILGADTDETNEFPHERAQLEEMLKTEDPELAADILQEARETWITMVDGRVESVERRAATLQGVVAIAATFALTGGTLIIAQIHGRGWRGLAGVALLTCVTLLALCGWLATQASSQYRRWVIHPRHAVFERPGQGIAQARVARAASFLYQAGNNSKHARWKVTKLRKAVSYLRLSLAALVAFAALMLVYATEGPQPASVASNPLPDHSVVSSPGSADIERSHRKVESIHVSGSSQRTKSHTAASLP